MVPPRQRPWPPLVGSSRRYRYRNGITRSHSSALPIRSWVEIRPPPWSTPSPNEEAPAPPPIPSNGKFAYGVPSRSIPNICV